MKTAYRIVSIPFGSETRVVVCYGDQTGILPFCKWHIPATDILGYIGQGSDAIWCNAVSFEVVRQLYDHLKAEGLNVSVLAANDQYLITVDDGKNE